MFKIIKQLENMPEYHPSGNIANNLFTLLYKLDVLEIRRAQHLMLRQLAYWRIQG